VFKLTYRGATPGTLAAAAVAGLALAGSAVTVAATPAAKAGKAAPAAHKTKAGAKGKAPGAKSRAKKPSAPTVALGKRVVLVALEALDAHGEIGAITGDNDFTYLHLRPGARLRMNGKPLAAANVQEGMKLVCWGAWDRYDPDVFNAVAASVKGQLDDYGVRKKIGDACRNVSRHYAHTAVAAAPVVVKELHAPPSAPSAPPAPSAPKPGAPAAEQAAPPAPTAPPVIPALPTAPPASREVPSPSPDPLPVTL
jgi:hypothetical protein